MKTPEIIKEAVEYAEKKKPGFWAGEAAASRAIGKGVLVDKELIKRRYEGILSLHAKGLGGGIGGGAALGLLVSVLSKGKIPLKHSIPAGGLGGAFIGESVADIMDEIRFKKVTRQWLKEKGFEQSKSGKITGMTEEAKKKYLSKKYEGGGYEKKGIPTVVQ